MSRTYRKNRRWYYKFRGDFYNHYGHCRSVKGNPRFYKDINDACRETFDPAFPCFSPVFGGYFFEEVIAGDGDNLCSIPSYIKKRKRRLSRRRAKRMLDAELFSDILVEE